MRPFTFSFFLILPILIACNGQNTTAFGESESTQIASTMQTYRDAWKRGDTATILQTLSPGMILFPAGKNAKPLIGKEAVSKFWFPESDISYPIIEYVITNEEINGSGNIAYYQGTSRLIWFTLENGTGRDTTTSISEFTNILVKLEDGWKIHRIMFNVKDENYQR